jgi:DNA-binding winged helix-turn-helix (wHTH) protein
MNADHYPQVSQKRMYVESRLGGRASDNLLPYLVEGHPDQIVTYQQLMEHLWNEYYDTKKEVEALDQYKRRKQ